MRPAASHTFTQTQPLPEQANAVLVIPLDDGRQVAAVGQRQLPQERQPLGFQGALDAVPAGPNSE
jgi:hypothetical protein